MKKILLFIGILVIALSSCDKEGVDDIFDKSPEERITEQLNIVRADLMSNEMGWLSTYTFSEGKEELVLLIKFIDETRAEITVPELGDFKQESSYSLRYTQQVDLVFDTYSFLAWLVDNGYKADFRWELDKQEDGQYFFKSRAASNEGESVLVLDKASPEKLEFALKVQELKAKMKPNLDISYFRVLELASGERFDYSFVDNKVVFEHIVGEEIIRFESEVTLNDNGFVLITPFVVGGKSISEFEYDETTGNFTIINADGVDGGINFSNSPAILPFGISEYRNTANYLLFIPSISLDNCSPKFLKVLDDLEVKGYPIARMELDIANKTIYININGSWKALYFEDKVKDEKVIFSYDGTSIADDLMFDALLPFLNVFYSANGHYFINEMDYYQYKGFSFVSTDYPFMKIHMIALN